MKLWIDDIRTPPSDDWLWARSVNQAITAIKCYEELKKVRSKYVDVMKAIRNAENSKITRCNFGVFMTNNVHDYYVDLVARLKKEVKDLKEKH